jgi:hypothetical protein
VFVPWKVSLLKLWKVWAFPLENSGMDTITMDKVLSNEFSDNLVFCLLLVEEVTKHSVLCSTLVMLMAVLASAVWPGKFLHYLRIP